MRKIILLCIGISWSSNLYSNSAELDVTESKTAAEAALVDTEVKNPTQDSALQQKSKFTISDGSRIDLNSKGFSISPPVGWEVHLNFPNVSLLMQKPYAPGEAYQRTIQVMRFQEGVPIDAITATDFENTITSKFSKALPAIEDYRIRNHLLTELEDRTPAVLYYSEFKIGDQNLMQAHLLTSSADHRYLITFTDVASHFEGENASKFLTEAWNSMVSMQIDSTPPIRLRTPVILGLLFGFSLLIALLILVVRKFKAGKEYGDLIEASDSMSLMQTNTQSTIISNVSNISNVKSNMKTQKESKAKENSKLSILKKSKPATSNALMELESIDLKDEEDLKDQWNLNNLDDVSDEKFDDLDEEETKAS